MELVEGRDPDLPGAELRVIREQCGLTLDQFGRLAQVKGTSVRTWELSHKLLIPKDVADIARELHTMLLGFKQSILDQYADCEPGDDVTLLLYQRESFSGPWHEMLVYNSAVGLAYHELVDDGLNAWITWA